MKKTKLLLLLFFISSGLFSQKYQYEHGFSSLFSLYRTEIYGQKDTRKHKIKELKIYELKNNIRVLTDEVQLDTSFDILYSAQNLNKRSPIIRTNTKINTRQIINTNYSRHSNYTTVRNFHISDSNKYYILSVLTLTNSRKIGSTKIFRNSNNKIDSIYYFKKNRNYFKTKWIYTYKNNKLFELKEFNKKNQLKSVIKYDCNPIGEKVKKVKQKSVCTNTEFDKDGNKIEVKTTTNNKGRVVKTKYTYDKNTNKRIKTERFDYKNRLEYFYHKTKDKTVNINYWKGKETYKFISYKKEGLTYKTEKHYKKKLKNTQEFDFNSKGLISKVINTDKKGKVTIQVYEYGYFD